MLAKIIGFKVPPESYYKLKVLTFNHMACRVFTNMLVCSSVRCVLCYEYCLQGPWI